MSQKEYYKLPSNIRGLRKAFGENITDLALAIGVGNTAISNYEIGERIPERDILKRIAKHFHITEDELIHGNFSDIKKIYSDSILDTQYNIDMINNMLPLFCNQKALENSNFKQAYKLDEKIFKYVKHESFEIANEDIERCLDYYFAAIDENIIEASANILHLLTFIGMIMCWINPKFWEEYDIIKNSPKKLIQSIYLTAIDDTIAPEWVEQRNSFLEEYESTFMLNIYRLKHSTEYRDLADYYLALRYIFGLVKNDNSTELNSSIGYQMISDFSILGNIYADWLCENQNPHPVDDK